MNILYIPRWFPNKYDPQFGVFTYKHAKAAARFGKVTVIYPCADESTDKAFEVVYTGENNLVTIIIYYRKRSRMLNVFSYGIALGKGLKLFRNKRGKPDLIHAHVLLRPYAAAWFLSKIWRVPYIITEHWTGFVYDAFQRKSSLYKSMTRFFIHGASASTLVSEGLKESVLRNGINHHRLNILANVIEIPALPEAEKQDRGVIRMLTVADLVETNKNISSVIRVLAELTDQLPDFEYHIIGGGPDLGLYKTLLSQFPALDNHVFLHGRQSNAFVLDFMKNIDFVIVNSNIETFSVVTAEAIGMGKPVIATRCGGPEFFVHQANGILINKGDNYALKTAILKMAQTCHQYNRQAMHDEMKEKFGEQTIGQQLFTLYKSVLLQS